MKSHKLLNYSHIVLFILIGACKKEKTNPPPYNNVTTTFSITGTWNIDSVETVNYINDSAGLSMTVIDSPYTLEFLTNGVAYYKKFNSIDTSNYFYNDSLSRLIIDMNNDYILDTTVFHKTSNVKCYFVGNIYKQINGNDTTRIEARYYIEKIN